MDDSPLFRNPEVTTQRRMYAEAFSFLVAEFGFVAQENPEFFMTPGVSALSLQYEHQAVRVYMWFDPYDIRCDVVVQGLVSGVAATDDALNRVGAFREGSDFHLEPWKPRSDVSNYVKRKSEILRGLLDDGVEGLVQVLDFAGQNVSRHPDWKGVLLPETTGDVAERLAEWRRRQGV